MNKQQTAVEWYNNQLRKVFSNTTEASNFSHEELLQQAKEMEKEQIIKAASNHCYPTCELATIDAEQYYNETYGGNNYLCCTPEGQIKRYVNCIGCDRKPLIQGGNK